MFQHRQSTIDNLAGWIMSDYERYTSHIGVVMNIDGAINNFSHRIKLFWLKWNCVTIAKKMYKSRSLFTKKYARVRAWEEEECVESLLAFNRFTNMSDMLDCTRCRHDSLMSIMSAFVVRWFWMGEAETFLKSFV